MPDQRPEPIARDLLSKKEVARKVRLSVRTIERYVALGKFPAPIRFSCTCIRWRRQDIDDYLQCLDVAHRSTAPSASRA